MGIPEIILIIACVAVVSGVAITSAIRKKQGKCSGGCGCDCANCHLCKKALEQTENAKKATND